MPRFFCAGGNISKGEITIDNPDDVHHIRDVLRLRRGNQLEVCDDKRNEYICVIKGMTSSGITLGIRQEKALRPEEGAAITVACAIPKKSMMDAVIDKLTQLGADRIIPMESSNVVVRLDAAKKAMRLSRWRKISRSASKQSQRRCVPIIEPVSQLSEVLAASADYDLKIIPTLIGERRTLKEVLNYVNPASILVLIGPEGDFTSDEIRLACSKGVVPVSLGKSVLRVDTAAIAVVSYLRLNL